VPVTGVYVDVTYADGTAYEGSARFVQEGTQRSILISQGRGELPAMPVADTLVVVSPRRPGYSTLIRTIGLDEIRSSGVVPLVLGKSEQSRAALVARALTPPGEYPPALDVYCTVVYNDVGRVVMRGRMPFTLERGLEHSNYQLRPGSYTVTARRGEYVAAKTVLLLPDQVTEVTLEWALGASVRVAVVDPEGKPLGGAVLRYAEGPYSEFPPTRTQDGTRAVTNRNGVAVLSGVAAFEQSFLIEAEGYEVYEFRAFPIAGATLDVPCRLKPASGRIIVALSNAVEGGKYAVGYGRPGMLAGSRTKLEIRTGEELVIDNLPVRPYIVYVQGGENGPGSAENIDLALTNGEARVVLDVAHLTSR
jgi:hypothetical protein